MPVKIRQPKGNSITMQNFVVGALNGIAEDYIEWLKVHRRIATGKSTNFVIDIKLRGAGQRTPTPNIEGKLIGVPYLNFALFGRGQGKAPTTDVILQWMRIRGIRGRDIQSGRFRNDREAAYAIAKQIGRVGTRALKMSPVVQDSIIGRNTREAIKAYTPTLANKEAKRLAEYFTSSLQDTTNMKVTIL